MHNILIRLGTLTEAGEKGESVMQRLNPPAKTVRVPSNWFVGDKGVAAWQLLVALSICFCVAISLALLLRDTSEGRGPSTERRAFDADNHICQNRSYIMTFTNGVLTGVSCYDRKSDRNKAMRG